MNQIQNQNPLFGSSSLNGASAAANAASANAARKDGVPAFAQWLNQSSQQLQTQQLQSQQQNQQLQAQQLQSQQQAQQLQNQQLQNQQAQQQAQNARDNAPKAPEPQHEPESTAAQDENKLAARNAAARNGANKAEGTRAQAHSANVDQAERTDATDAKDTAEAATAADAEGAEHAQAADGEGKDQKVAKESKDAKEAAATPGEQILAMLRGEAPTEAKAKGRGDSTEADAGDALPGGPQAHGKHQPTTGDAMRERQQLQRELAQAAGGAGKDAGAKDEALQAVSGQGAHEIALGDGKSAAPGAPHGFDAMLAAAQQPGATGTTGSSATGRAEPPSVPLNQPLHSPDFAPELSASVSLLLKDGIHEARLQLNPTDMGPVSINIQLDGQQAQVNFHAQQAATREVLERSLPDLAAALQAQGLTLSGGGVFAQQQSSGGQNQRDGSADGSSGGNGRRGGPGQDDGGIAATGRAERRTPARGLVDLYA